MSPHHPTRSLGSVVSFPSGVRVRAPAENRFYALFEVKKKPSGTPSTAMAGPQTSRGPGKLKLSPLALSTGLYKKTKMLDRKGAKAYEFLLLDRRNRSGNISFPILDILSRSGNS